MSFCVTFSPMLISVSSASQGMYNESAADDNARANFDPSHRHKHVCNILLFTVF